MYGDDKQDNVLNGMLGNGLGRGTIEYDQGRNTIIANGGADPEAQWNTGWNTGQPSSSIEISPEAAKGLGILILIGIAGFGLFAVGSAVVSALHEPVTRLVEYLTPEDALTKAWNAKFPQGTRPSCKTVNGQRECVAVPETPRAKPAVQNKPAQQPKAKSDSSKNTAVTTAEPSRQSRPDPALVRKASQEGAAAHRAGDFGRAKPLLETAAQGEDGRSLLLLGLMYASGDGVNQNNVTAMQYFERASTAQNAGGKFFYGVGLIEGVGGVKVNSTAGLSLVREAAAAGHQQATKWLRENAS